MHSSNRKLNRWARACLNRRPRRHRTCVSVRTLKEVPDLHYFKKADICMHAPVQAPQAPPYMRPAGDNAPQVLPRIVLAQPSKDASGGGGSPIDLDRAVSGGILASAVSGEPFNPDGAAQQVQ